MTRRLVLLRHGRTAWNHTMRVQGQLDPPLDDVGRDQAATAAVVMAKLEPSRLWSSDLARAAETAAAVASTTGLTVTHDPRLREFSLGVREGLTHEEFAAVAPEEFALFRLGHYDTVPGADQAGDVAARMAEAMGQLLATVEPAGTGIAVTHGAAARVAVGALVGWPDDQFRSLRGLDNCGWAVLEERSDADTLRLVAYNRTA